MVLQVIQSCYTGAIWVYLVVKSSQHNVLLLIKFKSSHMRNRQIYEYLIYPRFFNGHSILFKGTYCISYRLYHTTNNHKTTYAYPFLINTHRFANTAEEGVSLHTDGDFSFVSNKFEIVYEEERKKIDSQCIFRLQFDICKNYNIFLQVKLLKKIKETKMEDMGLCMRKNIETKYQVIDEDTIELRKGDIKSYERVYFRASEFFSSVDFYIKTFQYGYKSYRNKMQIANFFEGEVTQQTMKSKMKEKMQQLQKKSKRQDEISIIIELLKDPTVNIPVVYRQLLHMIEEHDRMVDDCLALLHSLSQNTHQIDAKLEKMSFEKLARILVQQSNIDLVVLSIHYMSNVNAEILCCILEEKQLVRRNMRKLRENYCYLLTFQSQKTFKHNILQNSKSLQDYLQQYFIQSTQDSFQLKEKHKVQKRSSSLTRYMLEQPLKSKRLSTIPYFLVETKSPPQKSQNKTTSITIFIHGYQGNSFDFQKAKNYLHKHCPRTHILIVQSITQEMNQSIQCLAIKAAEEIRKYLKNSFFGFNHINFIGFSLGGIIARAAFELLKQYWPKFNLFITFSSPHLGISQSSNSLVNIGVWYLIQIDKVKNLKQLNFQSVKMADSLLMRLSKSQALSSFKKVVLVCSKNDEFVPFYSTNLNQRYCEKKELKQICHNIVSKISTIDRIEVFFNIQNPGTLDKLTGRRGHIEFLDNDYFLEMFFKLYGSTI